MNPTKKERDALREVLFTPLEEFAEDEELAYKRMFTAAVEAVDDARAERGYFNVVAHFGGPVYITIGPYSTKKQAETALTEHILPMGPQGWCIAAGWNPGRLEQKLAEANVRPKLKGDWELVAEDAKAFKNGWKGNNRDRQQYV